jgi:nucleotide-binding universal stress UspA family protein
MFQRILVPVDRSDLAALAVKSAFVIADRFGSEVILLQIQKDAARLEHGDVDADLDLIEHDTKRLIASGLSHLRADHAVTTDRIRAEVRSGPLVETIVGTAAELMVDVIVMGTHGRHGVTEMFTGSTSEQVVAKTPASVLVIKPEGFPFLRN